ncbi:hypothetical protein IMSHALPRED_010516 [Imshaugia aleurites]|uniref:Uncharacterized protein n=1 Tax=Imshaugia aleurites TaxID=172621 RepID=A0A8H3G7J2_9LECA|nr:hypothetical protein IMSHALPRED_010516 [Imshaugia aleurites]
MKAFILVPCDFIYVVSESHFDVKPWLRDILLDLPTDESMDELAGRISLLLECSALRRVAVNLWGYRSMLKREIGTISRAFKPLAEKLGRRLMFRLSLHPKNSGHERDLKELETVDWDEVWFPGEMSSNSEGDEQ